MALVVIFSPDAPGFTPQTRFEYHVPLLWKDVAGMSALSEFVISVYADGHEHELILQRFKNLPSGHASTLWTGQFARFIADNFTSLAK